MTRAKIDRKSVDLSYITRLLQYNPETGILTWKDANHKRIGTVAGSLLHGYLVIMIGGLKFPAHRLAWLIYYGEWPTNQLDHINMVKTDNRICNLRVANHSQNQGNTLSYGRHLTKGISPLPSGNWQAKIGGKKSVNYLGSFSSKDEAAHAYNKAAIERFGEFAVLNPIGVDYEH